MESGREKSKTKKRRQETLKKQTNGECFARAGKTTDDVGRERRAENAAGRHGYHALERRHDAVARARDVAIAQCAEDRLVQEQILERTSRSA